MKRERQPEPDLIFHMSNLVQYAYPELSGLHLRATWGKLSSLAEIRWGNPREQISLSCDKTAKRWHESALVGLLSHELSHPCVSAGQRAEERTDADAIERGLGVYLAAERISTGRYLDQLVGRGRDRYLGYQSIRHRLTQHETRELDRLLDSMRIVSSISTVSSAQTIHDTAICGDRVLVGGYVFQGVSIQPESSAKLLVRDESVFLYVDDELAGETQTDSSGSS
jgi:hypothetical protein